ncbi:B box-type domain-containing protein [Abeliophyllum distichum]|uniref:B box-type domain-containing protein n=1 Tax=Abeliophyllum distichum TaxID=126358 RepID=A0ABD1VAS3_9LAMI
MKHQYSVWRMKLPSAPPVSTVSITPTNLLENTNAYSSSNFPLNNFLFVISEERAFLFCQQDKAILSREYDIPIHKANEHTQKYNIFLLTGVKLSVIFALYSSPSSSTSAESSLTNVFDSVPKMQSHTLLNKLVFVSVSETPTNPPPLIAKTTTSMIESTAVVPPPPATNDKSCGNIQK